jgi:hypothetical protein
MTCSAAPAAVPAIEERIPETAAVPRLTIDRDTVWENCERELGEVSIWNGAKLTIRHCTVRAFPVGGTQIYASPGTTLEILNTTMEDAPNSALEISIGAGARPLIRDSGFRGISSWAGGLLLGGDNALIENSEFADGYTGIRIESTCGHRIVNNRFLRNINCIFGSGEDLTIEGNRFSGNLMSAMSLAEAGRSRITGNHIENSLVGAGIAPGAGEIRGNVFFNNASTLSPGGGSTIAGNAFAGSGSWAWAQFGPEVVSGPAIASAWSAAEAPATTASRT